jgi:hypothetical protein
MSVGTPKEEEAKPERVLRFGGFMRAHPFRWLRLLARDVGVNHRRQEQHERHDVEGLACGAALLAVPFQEDGRRLPRA